MNGPGPSAGRGPLGAGRPWMKLTVIGAPVLACLCLVACGASNGDEEQPSPVEPAIEQGRPPGEQGPPHVGVGPIPTCMETNPDGRSCGQSTSLRCTTKELDCVCNFPGQSSGDDGQFGCKHRQARELVAVRAGTLTFDCRPPRPGENRLGGTATLSFDNRAGSVDVPFAINGINVALDATYTFSAAAVTTGDPHASNEPVARAGEQAEVTRGFSGGSVFNVPARWAAATGVDICSYCGNTAGVEIVANVMGETFEVAAPNVAITCTK